jgi:N-formylglutamate amidohydrolase
VTARGGGTRGVDRAAAIEELSTGPIVGVALHSAHRISADVASLLGIDDAMRLREEDPYTELWAGVADVRVVALRSRFEVDLNRSRERAVYLAPEHAWGLGVWREPPANALVERACALHDRFYADLRAALDRIVARFGRFVVLDLHSYNHRRAGPDSPPADPAANPEVNVGTGSMDRAQWAAVADGCVAALAGCDYFGRRLDVRENVRFKGGHLARWIHATYPGAGCALALEFKKVFMDEWTGRADPAAVVEIGRALAYAAGELRALLRAR